MSRHYFTKLQDEPRFYREAVAQRSLSEATGLPPHLFQVLYRGNGVYEWRGHRFRRPEWTAKADQLYADPHVSIWANEPWVYEVRMSWRGSK